METVTFLGKSNNDRSYSVLMRAGDLVRLSFVDFSVFQSRDEPDDKREQAVAVGGRRDCEWGADDGTRGRLDQPVSRSMRAG